MTSYKFSIKYRTVHMAFIQKSIFATNKNLLRFIKLNGLFGGAFTKTVLFEMVLQEALELLLKEAPP